jgi:subtilisin family serine protease
MSRVLSGLVMTSIASLVILVALSIGATPADERDDQRDAASEWPFLSTSTIRAQSFVEAHPEWDGRGVLIAVLDTGVALGLPGLTETPDGRTKVVDVRVFTDEDRISLDGAEHGEDEHGKALYASDGAWLYGFDQVRPQPVEGSDILVGYLKESAFTNSAVEDLNANGRSDEVFGLVAFRPAEDEPWAAVIDTDADRSLADETVVHDYSVAQEWFHLAGNDPHADADPVAFALNLWPDESAAALYFDGGAHGTHVAGIAAGYGINGQAGYNGIAPGAQIIAAKIGNNTLSGGATGPGSMIRAWRWAVERAKALDMPLIIQMSYGIGSEREGTADAERLIDSLLADHPRVAATLSAGNDGPGLSSVGLPAAASEPFSVAALLAADTAQAVYGVDLDSDRVFYFSSRGGELAKPDFACPGFAASTVPHTTGGRDVMRGTSMAAPQAAGACALLYSAAHQSGLPVRRDLLRAALTRTARPLPPYGPLDIGAGVVDVPAAWTAYQELAERPDSEPLLYRVTTASPDAVGHTGSTVFYRGGFFPHGQDRHEVTVDAVFPPAATDKEITGFYRAFELECAADWIAIDRPSTYLKQDRPASFRLLFQSGRLTRPGLYQTEVKVFNKRHDRVQRQRLGPELRVPVAVAVPHEIDRGGAFTAEIDALGPSVTHRAYVAIEPWTSSLDVEVELDETSRELSLLVAAFDPEGREIPLGRVSSRRPLLESHIPPHRVTAGVWEITITGAIENRHAADATLRVAQLPLVEAVSRTSPVAHDAGTAPSTEIAITSAMAETWTGQGSGRVVGTVHRTTEPVRGHSVSKPLQRAPEESILELRLAIPPEDWSLFTDVAVQVLDSDGRAVAQTGFIYRLLSFEVPAKAKGPFTLKILGGTADPDVSTPEWTLSIEEHHHYREPVPIELTANGDPEIVLYPYRTTGLTAQLTGTPPAPASGGRWLGAVQLEPTTPDQPALRFEVELTQAPKPASPQAQP